MDEQQVQQLLERLRNFRTRSEAADRLVALGRAAVEPLLGALESEGHAGARWVIISCLGEIGAGQAVPAIAPHLENTNYQTVAREALIKITGRDLGPMPDAYLRWAREHGQETVAPPPKEEMPDDRLLRLALEGSRADVRREAEGRYAVELPLEERRWQKVWVVFGSKDHEGADVVIVFANCGPAEPDHYEAALRMNLKMPYGAVALRDIEGAPQFVMFNTILRAGLSPVELRKSICTIGERSDRVRQQLCG